MDILSGRYSDSADGYIQLRQHVRAQVSYRAKEMATRRLLGSSARSIFWRLLGESALFTTGAFLLALLLAKAVEPTVCDLLQTRLDIWDDLNAITLLIYLIGIVLLSLLAGVVPAVLLSHYHPLDVVKGTFRRKTKAVYLRALYVVQSGLTVAHADLYPLSVRTNLPDSA